MNIITEHKYQQARWSTADTFWDRGHILVSDVIEHHNSSIIKLQGDHDEEVEHLRHRLADASQALTYARHGKEAADAKIRRMSETIRRQGEEAKRLRSVMRAAADEINEHWEAHCDDEGYGPTNLVRRLEEGLAVQYGAAE